MKILFIHNIIAPYRTPLFEALSKMYDIQVLFLERKDKNRKWDQKSEDMHFHHKFLENKNYSLFGKKITINTGLEEVFNEYKPDVLVTLDNPPNFLTVIYSIYLAKKNKIPIVLWTGAFDGYKTFQKSSFKSKLILLAINTFRKHIYSSINLFWAYSKATKDYLVNTYHIEENKIIDGLQGYPDELIYFSEVNLKKRYDNNKLLFIGYLDKRKGVNLLLQVFIELLNEFPNYTLEIIGTGDLYDKLINEHKDTLNIKFLGYKDGVEKFDIINESKYLILPSYSDPWGWVVNEATSCKVPALVSDSVMAKEILSDNKLIFKTGSSADLVGKLKYLMLLPYEDYEITSKKVYENSRLHTLDKAVKSFEIIYEELK